MGLSSDRRIVIVTRATQLASLRRTFSTRSHAKFQIISARQRELVRTGAAAATVQTLAEAAFKEVDDALADQKGTREQLKAQARQVETLKTYAGVACLRFENGYTSYIEVLDAERSLFNAELEYAQTQGNLFQSLVNLYKAMGGGWVNEADKITLTEGS